jgi:wyosine [tRNA(Phe)-imidazoG37] synthetase (radical SAM superfamily)
MATKVRTAAGAWRVVQRLVNRLGQNLGVWQNESLTFLWQNAFYCRVLSGESIYNLCINSDLTVSCNCQDYLGQGQLGNLNRQTLPEIFDGATATYFRRQLAEGKLPIEVCGYCPERQTIPRSRAGFYLHHYKLPRGIMVENTVLCNYQCLHCNRDVQALRDKKMMGVNGAEQVAHLLHDHHFEILYYFNLGEPFFPKTVGEELRLIRAANPDIKIHLSTNGVLLDTQEKRQAALLCNYIYVSLDGPNNELATLYQKNANFTRALENMTELVKLRDAAGLQEPIIEWKYVVFRWNDNADHVQEAIRLAKQANVDVLAFTLGGGLRHELSKNFHTAPHFTQIPMHSWQGRVVDLRTNGRYNVAW